MLHHLEFDSGNKIFRCRFEGDVTDESLEDCYKVAVKGAALTDPRAGIVDFSSVTSVEVSAMTVRDLAYRAPVMPSCLPRFLVAPSACLYGLARMFQQYGSEERPELHVVRSVDEAYTFLAVREPQFEPLRAAATNRNPIRWPKLSQSRALPPKPLLVRAGSPEDERSELLGAIYNLAAQIEQTRDLGNLYEYIEQLNAIKTKLGGLGPANSAAQP